MDNRTKKIGLISATAIVAGNMMGSGIALLPAYLASIGSITIISWIVTILGALALGYVFARLGLTNPQAGGPIAYSEDVSPILGFQAGALYFYANWVGNVGMAITGVSYLSFFFPILSHSLYASLVAIIVIWILAAINLMGADWVGKLVTIGLILLLTPVLLTGTLGWIYFDWHTFVANWNVSHNSSFNAFTAGTTTCLWSFVGLESATTNANITDNPEKTIPRATLLGIGVCALVYFLSNMVMLGMFPAKNLAASTAPFAMASAKMLGSWSMPWVAGFTAFTCFASLCSWMMLLTQAGVRASKDGILIKAFSELNKNNLPQKGLLITATVMSVILLLMSCFSSSAQELFGHIISISVLLLIFPYFYCVLDFAKQIATQNSKKFRFFICCIAAVFCFIAFCGAQKRSLEVTVIICLLILFFYSCRNENTSISTIEKNKN